ncbi:MFS transporter [Pseudomonas sp. S44]|uniref:MFS transporter n=1 Tax=Pseudomonas sp. S44 TaxID=2767450 RepID=UPI001F163E35|nr:MFS transporter [Pseudomonas sp. S44]
MNDEPVTKMNKPVLAALAGSILLASLGVSIATVALASLARVFSVSVQQVQWVVLAYLLALTAAIVVAGRMGDLYGSRRVLLIGLGVFTVASGACALAPGLDWLIVARAVQGLGAAVLMALPLSIAKGLVAKERLGTAMGLLGTMSAIGTALGPSLGGVLIGAFGWRAAFVLLLLCGASMLVLTLTGIPRTKIPSARITRSSTRPLIPLAVLRRPGVATSLAMNILAGAVMMSTLVVGPFFLSFGLGLSDAQMGVVMAAGPIGAAVSGVPAGRVVDRFGTRRTLLGGLLVASAGLVCFAVLPRLIGVAGYVLALVLVTPGFQLFLAANNTAVMANATEEYRGLLSGLLGLSRNLGLMTGAAALPLLFACLLGTHGLADISAQVIGTAFSITFLSAAGLCVLAVALALLDQRKRGPYASSVAQTGNHNG